MSFKRFRRILVRLLTVVVILATVGSTVRAMIRATPTA